MMIPIAVAVIAFANASAQKPQTVVHVDLTRYAGRWYEIAKIPNRFQRKCSSGTTAEYSLRDDGRIGVINRCQKADGSTTEVQGIAKIVDPDSNARLKVSFVSLLGWHLFWGDYWIIGLDDNYTYAVVGTPNRKYGWILSRTPQLSPEKMTQIQSLIRNQGYNPTDFEMTIQNNNPDR
ncbi:lipocalin family protein [candidate division KSB1 bacterium]|nr:lipocalin family protein [candidate division KSB1 bacterium]